LQIPRWRSASSASPGAIQGRVDIAAALKARVEPGDTLFIFARVPGERMPRALARRRAAELPLDFRLDDSMAMNPAAKLSDAKVVEIVARVSRSGSATPQPGDREAVSAKVKPGARRARHDQVRRPQIPINGNRLT
jgi:cytochrome c-type biogenesis protein CcmH